MRIFPQYTELPAFRNCILTIGTFDGVHKGHQEILRRMAAVSTRLAGESILITFDPHPRSILDPRNSPRLLSPLPEKLDLLERFGLQNVVVVPFTTAFAHQSANDYIDSFLVPYFKPRYIIIGYDHRYGKNREGGLNLLHEKQAAAGFEVEEISKQLVDDIAISSTKIRKALEAGEIESANQLLGYNYMFRGKVESGRRLGRSIGFPTANITLDCSDKLLPANGVYAVRVLYEKNTYNGMLNIGFRPTFEARQDLSIEVNLFDFEGDLYGQYLSIEPVCYLRTEKKFDGIEALIAQLQHDKEMAIHLLGKK